MKTFTVMGRILILMQVFVFFFTELSLSYLIPQASNAPVATLHEIERTSVMAHVDYSEGRHEDVSLKELLNFPLNFHNKTVRIRGTVAQPEMHLTETKLFFKFVFLLKDQDKSIVVFGQHDRTQGSSPLAMGNKVEVIGIFWKNRIDHNVHFKNNLEAITIHPYPSLVPSKT